MSICVVTGGSRGIGNAACLALAGEGYDVVLSYQTNTDAAAKTKAQVEALGRRAVAVQGDVAAETDVLQLFAAAQDLGPVTAVVNNAAIVAPSLPLAEVSFERMQRMFSVNVLGAYCVAREAVRCMMRSRGGAGGSLVNISSIAARMGSPGEYVDYAGSKAAVDALTRGLALEVAQDGVRVNCVRPGLIETELHASGGQPDRAQRLGKRTPMGRPGLAQEIADAITWLVSDRASYVTGALVDVSGGR